MRDGSGDGRMGGKCMASGRSLRCVQDKESAGFHQSAGSELRTGEGDWPGEEDRARHARQRSWICRAAIRVRCRATAVRPTGDSPSRSAQRPPGFRAGSGAALRPCRRLSAPRGCCFARGSGGAARGVISGTRARDAASKASGRSPGASPFLEQARTPSAESGKLEPACPSYIVVRYYARVQRRSRSRDDRPSATALSGASLTLVSIPV